MHRINLYLGAVALLATSVHAQTPVVPPAAAQNPSPMVEQSRAHQRIAPRKLEGIETSFSGPLGKVVPVFFPAKTRANRALNLVLYFHGDAFIPKLAVQELGNNHVVAVLNLGSGSGVYDRSFSNPAAYDSLIASVSRVADSVYTRHASIGTVTLVGFSAGHGAIRAIIRDGAHFRQVNAILLLDGMHASYVPEGSLIASGGKLDTMNLSAFGNFAREAMGGRKRFLVTHSEIFPGTFASTTETADYLITGLGLHRTPVLRWGPGGMQQLSDVKKGNFEIRGFAGNAGPDHIDHAQGLPVFLRDLLK